MKRVNEGTLLVIHRCPDCGRWEGERVQAGCCPGCGRATEPLRYEVEVKRRLSVEDRSE